MRKQLVFAIVGILAVAAAAKKPSAAQIAEQDKKNWGSVDYSAGVPGENSIADDLAQMKSQAAADTATMSKLQKQTEELIASGSSAPEYYVVEALKVISRPLDPTGKRTFDEVSATPAQKLGIKSLEGAKHALDFFERAMRIPARTHLKTLRESQLHYAYNVMNRIVNFDAIRNGALVNRFRQIDAGWAKYKKLVDQLANGTDGHRFDAVAVPSRRDEVFMELLKECGLDKTFDARGRVKPDAGRYFHMLDSYFKRANDKFIAEFVEAYEKVFVSHNALADAHAKFSKWFADAGLKLDPYPRKFIKEMFVAYHTFIHEEYVFLSKYGDLREIVEDQSSNFNLLRKCKDISPNGALFVDSGPVSDRPPAYVRRMGELGRALRKRFDDAVQKRQATRPAIVP